MSIAGLNGAAARSSKQVRRHLVLQPLAGREPPDLVAGEGVGAGERPARVAGHVGADQDTRQPPERVIRRQRLRLGHVEGGTQSTAPNGIDEGRRIDRRTASSVHEEGAGPQQPEAAGIQQPGRFHTERQQVDQDIGGRERPIEIL